jgi:hypothetical protein
MGLKPPHTMFALAFDERRPERLSCAANDGDVRADPDPMFFPHSREKTGCDPRKTLLHRQETIGHQRFERDFTESAGTNFRRRELAGKFGRPSLAWDISI